MPGFASRDDIINEMTVNGKQEIFHFQKATASNSQGAGIWHTLWKGAGNPSAGADPAVTPGTVYSSDGGAPLAGSIWFPDRSTDQKHIISFGAIATVACNVMLYDRLAGVSGVTLNSTGTKTINSGALSRYSGTEAENNEAWLELTTGTTTPAPVANLLTYTAADGSTGNVGGSVTLPAATTVAGTMIQLPQAASKRGVRSVETLNVGTAGGAGAANLLIIRPLVRIPLAANQWNEVNLLDDLMTLPRVHDNATLGIAVLCQAATGCTVYGTLTAAYG